MGERIYKAKCDKASDCNLAACGSLKMILRNATFRERYGGGWRREDKMGRDFDLNPSGFFFNNKSVLLP